MSTYTCDILGSLKPGSASGTEIYQNVLASFFSDQPNNGREMFLGVSSSTDQTKPLSPEELTLKRRSLFLHKVLPLLRTRLKTELVMNAVSQGVPGLDLDLLQGFLTDNIHIG